MEQNYEAPSISELGTVAELTLNVNFGSHKDSNYTGPVGPGGSLNGQLS